MSSIFSQIKIRPHSLEDAAEIALGTAIDYLKEHTDIELIRFVLFGQKNCDIYEQILKRKQQQF